MDADSGNRISEIRYGQQVSLRTRIDHSENNSATITIRKKDGTPFESGKSQLSFTEEITNDGKITLDPFEIKSLWEEASENESVALIADITHGDAKKSSGELTLLPSPKVLVNFRTGNSYDGEYGFDWIRMGDTGKPGDVWYKDIIGRYESKKFVQDDKEYNKLGKLFEMVDHPTKPKDKYVVPVLALLPNKKATLTLKVEVKGSDAEKIEFKYDKTYFKLNKTEVSHKTVGKKELADDLTIECIKEFGSNQYIEVLADGNFAGKLKVIANDKAHRYKANIVFVKVRTDLNGRKDKGKIYNVSGEDTYLSKYFKQAFIEPNIIEKELDLRNDSVLNSTYKLTFMRKKYINSIKGIHKHLRIAFEEKHPGFKNYLKVFFFGVEGGKMKIDNTGSKYYRGLNGSAENINSKAVVLYDSHNNSTTTHEVLHAMGLHHTFSNRSALTLKEGQTDNIMDYSHQSRYGKINRISTYQWQWANIHNHLETNKNINEEHIDHV